MLSTSTKTLCALIAISCAWVALSAPIAAQTPVEKTPQFGFSLKTPPGESKKVSEHTSPKGNLSPSEDTIRIDTSLVVLDVTVTDAGGQKYITGLSKDDFTLVEDNQPQTVATLTLGDDAARLPRSIVLIFDRSDSELPYLESSIEAARTLVNQLTPSDEMAIVTDDVELASGFTKDKKKLKQTLDTLKKLTLTGFHTRSMQFSALLATLRELIDTRTRRPIIILQTDGDEVTRLSTAVPKRPSNYDMDTVYSEVERSRTKIYTVVPGERLTGLPKDEVAKRVTMMLEMARLARARYKDMWYGYERLPPKPSPKPRDGPQFERLEQLKQVLREQAAEAFERACEQRVLAQAAAAQVAELTGGWTSFLEKPEQANEIYGRILADINHRYILSYYSTNKEPDGKLRSVRIEVRGHPEYSVTGRTSYYARPIE